MEGTLDARMTPLVLLLLFLLGESKIQIDVGYSRHLSLSILDCIPVHFLPHQAAQ
jgi:hypothetical protein